MEMIGLHNDKQADRHRDRHNIDGHDETDL